MIQTIGIVVRASAS